MRSVGGPARGNSAKAASAVDETTAAAPTVLARWLPIQRQGFLFPLERSPALQARIPLARVLLSDAAIERPRECSRNTTRRRGEPCSLLATRPASSELGVIESEHILLGILREGEETVSELFRRLKVKPGEVRREIEGERVFVERISSTAELPLSEESKKILAYASHEAESMLHSSVGSEHLLIGLLRVENCFATGVLAQHGFDVYNVREEVLRSSRSARPVSRRRSCRFSPSTVAT